MLGILIIDKPTGITSHDVVNQVRRRFGTRRVGHAGTLDPLATGLLVVAVGPATRFLQYLPLEPKQYLGRFQFGVSTDSYDSEGAVTSEREVPDDLLLRIEQCLPSFQGLIQQLPPMYSAVKVAGKPLYHYARSGKDLKREPRSVHIGAYDVVEVGESWIDFRITCSGGTYIRTLAHDLGEAIGCGAHLTGLRRERVGRYDLGNAKPLSDVTPDDLIPLVEALRPMRMVSLDDVQVAAIREGRALKMVPEGPLEHVYGLLDPDGNLFSVARVLNDVLQPDCVIPQEAIHGLL